MPEIFSDWGQKEENSIIKVIGVGGGGGNAVKHMYKEGIVGVNFLICNTDRQAVENNPVPSKLVLGESGLGAGANPEVAEAEAEKSVDKIKDFLGDKTKMLFVAAGMGKGTGTGASPVIARIAKEMGILTIGVVTYPFNFEGKGRRRYADEGIEKLKEDVDSLLVVNNQNIMTYYKDDDLDRAFAHADDVLKDAVKCIAELITVNAEQNIDFNDIQTVMKDSNVALLGLGCAEGENRVDEVLDQALNCPLLNDNDITGAKNFLFFISYGPDCKLTMDELSRLTTRFEELQCDTEQLIWGRNENPNLGASLQLSIVATGFPSYKKEEILAKVNIATAASNPENRVSQPHLSTATPNITSTKTVPETVIIQPQPFTPPVSYHEPVVETQPSMTQIPQDMAQQSNQEPINQTISTPKIDTTEASNTDFNKTYAQVLKNVKQEYTNPNNNPQTFEEPIVAPKSELIYESDYDKLFKNIERPAIWLEQNNHDLEDLEHQEISDDSAIIFKNMPD